MTAPTLRPTRTEGGVIDVFLLDDHEVVRRGLRAALEAEDDLRVVGEAGEAGQALDVVRRTAPDVAVLDVRLGDGNGIDVCRQITSEFPDVRGLILTSFNSDRAIVDARLAGAVGFVTKQVRSKELIEAIRQVADGRRLLDDAEVRMAMRHLRDREDGRILDLTPQEHRILDLVGEGMTNRQIAAEMCLAEKTIKNYVSRVLTKLGMARRAEAAALAARIAERALHDD